ncbi:MAG TPA: protein phosphatase 2C domain-containing protein, partial [Acidobacteriota bacterium]|nr:protein phosphatase 2C domain-containing protein [Acidobacteriota bacterium]
MKEPLLFYKALDPQKGSWDGYGIFPIAEDDFLAYVTDAPSAASIHTPELIKNFWTEYARSDIDKNPQPDLAKIEFADSVNQLQHYLQKRSRSDGALYQATLCLVRKTGSRLLYCSIGDSVLQLLRKEKLYRLTNEEIWDGHLIIRETFNVKERQRTKPLRFVGENGEFVEPSEISSCELLEGDLLILNTDGIEDLLPPDRLIPLLRRDGEQFRLEMERIFTKSPPKDDVTLISIHLSVPARFDSQKEIGDLRSRMDTIHKKQEQLHTEISHAALPAARLDKLERVLQQFSKQVQELSKRLDSSQGSRTYSPVTYRAKPFAVTRAFLSAVAAFIIGVAGASAFFLLNGDR